MKILGHKLIPYTNLRSISCIEEMSQDKEEIVLFEYDPKLIEKAQELGKNFALYIFNETEAVIGNATKAKILICPEKLASKVQNLAEYYLFDAKVALLINSEEEIAKAIEKKVDMAILPDAIL